MAGLFGTILFVNCTNLIARSGAFTTLSVTFVLQAILANLIKIAFGLFYPSGLVLILSAAAIPYIGVIILSPKLLSRYSLRYITTKLSASSIRAQIIQHRQFVLFRTPQSSFNALSHVIPILYMTNFVGVAQAGLFALTRSVLNVPALIVADSISKVIYPHFAREVRGRGLLFKPTLQATISLAAIGIVPFGAVVVIGPDLFEVAFGKEWRLAGNFASWMSLLAFANFINRPAVALISVLEAQRGLLIFEVANTAGRMIALHAGYTYYRGAVPAVAALAIYGSIMYALLIIWALMRARSYEKGEP
jgi:O-antigen/teichoic acid export membrane protein